MKAVQIPEASRTHHCRYRLEMYQLENGLHVEILHKDIIIHNNIMCVLIHTYT